jgi:hypothetical protein
MSEPSDLLPYPPLRRQRDADSIVVMARHSNDGPRNFTAADHESDVDAFYEVGRERANRVPIIKEVGYERAPEGASAAALVKSRKARTS